jgi:pimeloyl-ACP methyl ester carboxylesterase
MTVRWLWLIILLGCAPPPNPAQLPLLQGGDRAVLLFHGGGEGEDPSVWADQMKADIDDALLVRGDASWQVVAYDWSLRSDSQTTAAGNGEAEGDAIAQQLLEGGGAHLHLIAHSVGTAVAARVVQRLVEANSTMTTHLTYLDPFGLFGAPACMANQCESWRNTDDGVPGSDDVVPSAVNYDVTSLRPAGERGHWWPVEA